MLSQQCRKPVINNLRDFSKCLSQGCRNVVATENKICRKFVATIKSMSYENNDNATKTIKDIYATPPHIPIGMWGVANVAWREGME